MNADKSGYCMRNLRLFAVRYNSKDQKKLKSIPFRTQSFRINRKAPPQGQEKQIGTGTLTE
jgi:hypothetical protein